MLNESKHCERTPCNQIQNVCFGIGTQIVETGADKSGSVRCLTLCNQIDAAAAGAAHLQL